MEENPQKFKQTQEEEEAKAKEEAERKAAEEAEKKAAEEKQEEPAGEGEEGEAAEKEEVPEVKKKRAPIDKQTAYLEFKGGEGQKIENSIIMSRNDIKDKRVEVKGLTQKINASKAEIDNLKVKLDKKEEERKL